MADSKFSMRRGHEIEEVSAGRFVYCDTGQPVPDNPYRDCGFCGIAGTPEADDGCIGYVYGLMNACCGHGHSEAWAQTPDGEVVTGEPAWRLFNISMKSRASAGKASDDCLSMETRVRRLCEERDALREQLQQANDRIAVLEPLEWGLENES